MWLWKICMTPFCFSRHQHFLRFSKKDFFGFYQVLSKRGKSVEYVPFSFLIVPCSLYPKTIVISSCLGKIYFLVFVPHQTLLWRQPPLWWKWPLVSCTCSHSGLKVFVKFSYLWLAKSPKNLVPLVKYFWNTTVYPRIPNWSWVEECERQKCHNILFSRK